ncbi:MAG: TolC family protein [Nitrospiria bacterium]
MKFYIYTKVLTLLDSFLYPSAVRALLVFSLMFLPFLTAEAQSKGEDSSTSLSLSTFGDNKLSLFENNKTLFASSIDNEGSIDQRTIDPKKQFNDHAGPNLSLVEMIDQLKAHNPQLEQARKNYLAAKAIAPQVLAPNNPQLGIVNNPTTGNPITLDHSQFFYYTLTQSFPFPGKKRLPAQIAEDQAEMINSQTESLYLQLVNQLKINFYQLLLLQRQYNINQETIQRLEQIKEISKVRYSQNAAAYVDYLNAQVAKSSAENDQFGVERQIETSRQTLNTLVGRDPGTPLIITGDISEQTLTDKTLLELENLALEHNPNVKASTLQVEAAKKSIDLANLAYYPDFNVILYFNSTNPPIGYTNLSSYGTEFDIVFPLWFNRKEKYGVIQANATLEASQASDLSIRQQLRLAVDSAYNALSQAVNQTQFIKNHQIVEAKTAYRLALTNYSSGGAGFIDLLTSQNNFRISELGLAQSEISAIQAYANLVAALGTEIH